LLKNEEIKAKKVLLIRESTKEVSIEEALQIAEEQGLDLVQLNDKAIPSCKIMDYSKHLFEQKKKKAFKPILREKEIQFEPNIADHDLQHKLNQSISFVEKGHKVVIKVILKGRNKDRENVGLDLISSLNGKLNTKNLKLVYKKEGSNFKGVIEKI
jgi:translation initiation factor IF-3